MLPDFACVACRVVSRVESAYAGTVTVDESLGGFQNVED